MLDRTETRRLAGQARALGFDLCGVAPAAEFEELRRLPDWLARGYAGEMKYMRDSRRAKLQDALAGARSVVVCALNYNTPLPYSTVANSGDESKTAGPAQSPRGWISRYAWGNDYHDVLGRKLEELLAWMRREFGNEFQAKFYADTGPVLERVAAKYAGLGWLGKNTCLINQQLGSWLFLGVILTDLELAPSLAADDPLPRDLCGSCRRCIDACPTQAIVEPYVLDARRCISYLTIELRGSIPEEFRPAMGNMVFGCDICQDVCPWNRKAPITQLAEFLPREISAPSRASGGGRKETKPAEDEGAKQIEDLCNPPLEWLLSLDEENFRQIFRGSAVKRAKWRGLLRNACVAAGNSRLVPGARQSSRMVSRLEELAGSEDAGIAEHARWALARLDSRRLSPSSSAD
jgi:epoxyqueuosine reductase